MPAVAVGVAVAADVGAGAALAAGTLTTLGAVAAIGATIGAVGAVTGNKTLSDIGLGLGAIGGIGALASSAGLLGSGADPTVSSLFGTDGAAASGADATDAIETTQGGGLQMSPTGDTTVSNVTPDPASTLSGDIQTTEGNSSGLINTQNAQALTADQQNGMAAAMGGNAAGATGAGAAAPEPAPSAAAVQPPTPNSGAAEVASTSSTNANPINVTQGSGLTNPFTQANAPAGAAPALTSEAASKSSGILAFANKNPMIAFGALQAGGSLLSGLTNPATPAQIGALNAQSTANKAAAAMTQQQTTNMQQPTPVAVSTGTPPPAGSPIIQRAGTGLINQPQPMQPQIPATPIPPPVGGQR